MLFSAPGEDKMSTELLGCPALSAKTLANLITLECMQILGECRLRGFLLLGFCHLLQQELSGI